MLSNTCKYGIRAVIYLAANAGQEKKIGIKTISHELGIPTPFLGKILQSMAKHKILSSTKGPHGGFGLGKSAEKITLMDIILIIDGEDVLDMCLIDLKTCKKIDAEGSPCPIHGKYVSIRNQIVELFNQQTIAGLVKEMKENKEIHI
jgi:Rrf2 family iron-sulfur cluster assembly transcriptional regulator